MTGKWKIAVTCSVFSSLSLTCFWVLTGGLDQFQWLCLMLTAGALLWLAIPVQIKQPLEALLADPRYADIDWPDEWSDFVAICGMILAMFLVFL